MAQFESRDWDQPLDGFVVESAPTGTFTNLVLRLRHPNLGLWFLKVFTDSLQPGLEIYDAEWREILAYRLGTYFGGAVPVCKRFADKPFTILVQDAGDRDLAQYLQGADAGTRSRAADELAAILVLSHWIGDHERAVEHIRVDKSGKLLGIDYQCAGPGGLDVAEHSVWPHTIEYAGRSSFEFNDPERMLHFAGFPQVKPTKPGIQSLAAGLLPEMLEVARYDQPLAIVETFVDTDLASAFDGLEFRRRGARHRSERRIDELYMRMLRERRHSIRSVFERWLGWLQARSGP